MKPPILVMFAPAASHVGPILRGADDEYTMTPLPLFGYPDGPPVLFLTYRTPPL